MRALHVRRGRVLDPASNTDRELDVVLSEGRIVALGAGLAAPAGAEEIDARGMLVVPGLIDLHAHLREPGEEYKEDIASASASAAAGGFAAVCAMPNTTPVNDTRAVTELILERARAVAGVRVYPIGAITRGLEGQALSEMAELREAGCVAVSDDGKCVASAGLMRRALEYARTFGLPVIQHAEDPTLSLGGSMNESVSSTRAGLRGQPHEAESTIVARDIALVERTGARYHVAHVSTQASVWLVREAKRRGLPVTCEVTPHHLTLTDEACLGYDTLTKCNPPLREAADVEALREALADGTIDAVATDHAPHTPVEKDLEFDHAASGIVGFETALPLVLALVASSRLTLAQAIERLTAGPARVLGLPGGTLAAGAPADVTIVDLERAFTPRADTLRSKSKNSPFLGRAFCGRAMLTIVGGTIVFDGRAEPAA
ncbi:MAG: dihydroorotase [Myxococcota bacterium]